MTLTQDRAAMISEVLNANPQQAQELLVMEPSDAAAKMEGLGHDFTVEELQEYGNNIRSASGSVNDDALEGVSGGFDAADVDRSNLTHPAPMPIMPLPGIIGLLPIQGITPHPGIITQPIEPIVVRPLPIDLIKW